MGVIDNGGMDRNWILYPSARMRMIVRSASKFSHSREKPESLPPITGGNREKIPWAEGGT